MAKLTRLLRLIGPILKNWLIKVCEEITKHAAERRRKCVNNTCENINKDTHSQHACMHGYTHAPACLQRGSCGHSSLLEFISIY